MKVPVSVLKKYSYKGVCYRCFDHVIAVQSGLVVAVPTTIVSGPVQGVHPYCPLPWEEMWAILDTAPSAEAEFDTDLFAHIPQILNELGLSKEVFKTAPLPEYKSTVFVHASGIRVGISNDLIEEI